MIRRIAAQTKIELLLTLRRGESLLVVAGIPVGILVFFSTVDVLPHHGSTAVDFLVPGVLALAVISSAMTSLGIATGFERHAGVLRRLGTTPLGREGLLIAKIVSLSAIVALQVVLIGAVGYGLGWRPKASVVVAIGLIALGVVAFAGLGFLLAGRLRAETNLAAANGLFLVFLLLGGIVVPVARLPEALRALARALPAEPLATSVRAALVGTHVPGRALVALVVWAVGACLLAVATFRWD
jgi:ABC-2 type transport system permease protein